MAQFWGYPKSIVSSISSYTSVKWFRIESSSNCSPKYAWVCACVCMSVGVGYVRGGGSSSFHWGVMHADMHAITCMLTHNAHGSPSSHAP